MNDAVATDTQFIGRLAIDAFSSCFNTRLKRLVERLDIEIVIEPSLENGVEYIAFYPAGEDCEIQFSFILSPLFEVPEGGNSLELVKLRVWSALDRGKEIHEFFLDPYSYTFRKELAAIVRFLKGRSSELSRQTSDTSQERSS